MFLRFTNLTPSTHNSSHCADREATFVAMALGGQSIESRIPDSHWTLSNLITPLGYFSSFENPLLVMELWIVALLWLLWRLWSVLTTPTDLLKSILGRTPILLPEITVDQLAHQWAAVRWRYPAHARHAAKHLIELVEPNGSKRLLETERSQSRMVLEDLQPNTEYSVFLYAQPGRRLAAQISLHTMKEAHESAPITEWTQPHLHSPNRNVRDPPQKSISQLKQEIEQLQADFNKEHFARTTAATEFKSQQAELHAELELVAAARRTEQSLRGQQRSEIKALEDLKLSLDSKRKSELKRNKELQQSLNIQHSTQNRWTTELGDRRIRLQEKTNKLQKKQESWDKERQNLYSRSKALSSTVQELEKEVKQATASLKEAERARDRSRELISKLEKHTDITSGLLSDDFTAEGDFTDQELMLIEEFQKDSSTEQEWVAVQEALERRYVAAYQQHEQANRALETAQARAAAQSQAQAQIYASAFSSHSSLSVPQSSQPAVSLLPSNLFKDDPPSQQTTHLPPSPSITSSQFGYPTWKPVSHRSRDSSIFFSAPASVNEERSSSMDISLLGESPFEHVDDEDLLSTPKPTDASSSTTNSPEKFRWARLGKKQGTPTSATNFVRRLSFFRKDSKQEDEIA